MCEIFYLRMYRMDGFSRASSLQFHPKKHYDPKIKIRGIPSLFPQSQSEDKETPQPGNVQFIGSRQEARERDPVFQTALSTGNSGSYKYRFSLSILIWIRKEFVYGSALSLSPVIGLN
jgi:hypothetical protein